MTTQSCGGAVKSSPSTPSDRAVLEWAKRHDITGSLSELRAMVMDARSLEDALVNGIPTNEDPPSLR